MKLLKKLGNNPYFNALRNVQILLDKDQKSRGLIMFLLLLVNAIFDVLGLAIIFPLIDAALAPDSIQDKWYLAYPYKWIGAEDNITFLLILSIIIFIVFLLKNLFSILIFYIQSKFSFNVSLRLSRKFFQHYYKQGFLYINDEDSGAKAYNIINVPYYFAASYLLNTFVLSTELVVLSIIFLSILLYKPSAIIVLLVVIIPVFIIVYAFTKNKVKSLGDRRNILYPNTYSTVLESMSAYVDIKLGNKEQFFFDNYSNLLKSVNKIDALYQGVYGKIPQRMNDIVLGLGIMVVFAFAYIFEENSEAILSILSVFGLAAYRFLPSVNRIMAATLVIKNTSYTIEKMKAIKASSIESYTQVPPLKIRNSISFKDISYTYPNSDKKILSNINFSVQKGETIGLVGSSGSGKTTLLNLLLRFIKETSGVLEVDKQALDSSLDASFQKSIGYVQQAVFIKKGSLIENIAFGEFPEEVNKDKVKQAIKDSMLTDFVNSYPSIEEIMLGENGVKLSGGQKQRIGIARALYKDSELLVFDEATSALDTETESAIVKTINNLTKLNKIIIIVAHRVSTLEKCDWIYELQNGSISRKVKYHELLSPKQ